MNLPAFFEEDRAAVDAALDRLMPGEDTQPPSIHRAMRYSVQAGGKRVRPILVPGIRADFFRGRGSRAAGRVRARIHSHLFADSR